MKKQSDLVVTVGMMLARAGFLVAVILGVAMLAGLRGPTVPVHMLVGIKALLGVLIAAVRFAMLKQVSIPLWGGFAVLLAGTTISLGMWGPGYGLVHAFVMILGIGLAEMGAARARRAMLQSRSQS